MTRLHLGPVDELAAEMDGLGRELEAVIDEIRAERLDARMVECKGVPVRRTRTSLSGDRVTLRLKEGTTVTMELLAPQRARLATLRSVRRRCSTSWIVRGRTTAGDDLTYLASRVRVTPPG